MAGRRRDKGRGVSDLKMKNEQRLSRTVILYACPIEGCPMFMGTETDDDPNGGHGWNPDGWPRCTTHQRPALPVKVEAVRGSPIDHPAGCFYGSFAGAYSDRWHIPQGVECGLDHGEDPMRLGADADEREAA
jgi:hypothetical protein